MPVQEIENFLRKEVNNHIVKSHSWVTAPLDNFENSHVIETKIDNFVSFRQFPQSIYGIQPNYLQTAEAYFFEDFGADFDPE